MPPPDQPDSERAGQTSSVGTTCGTVCEAPSWLRTEVAWHTTRLARLQSTAGTGTCSKVDMFTLICKLIIYIHISIDGLVFKVKYLMGSKKKTTVNIINIVV